MPESGVYLLRVTKELLREALSKLEEAVTSKSLSLNAQFNLNSLGTEAVNAIGIAAKQDMQSGMNYIYFSDLNAGS